MQREDAKTFEVEIRIRNNRVKAARTELGLSTHEAAELAGVSYPSYLDIENMKKSPRAKNGEFRIIADKIAIAFGMLCEYLFPPAVDRVTKSVSCGTFDESELPPAMLAEIDYLPPHQDDDVQLSEFREAIEERLKEFTPRQEKIIRMRFFEGMTYEAIGESLGVSRERIRQIEQGVLRALRRHSSGLSDFDDNKPWRERVKKEKSEAFNDAMNDYRGGRRSAPPFRREYFL